jgi:hypothetical protein
LGLGPDAQDGTSQHMRAGVPDGFKFGHDRGKVIRL